MIEVYGTTLASVGEIKRGMLLRRLASFQVVVDVRLIEDDGVRTRRRWNDYARIEGLVEVAR